MQVVKATKAKKVKNKIVVNSWQHIHTYIIGHYNPFVRITA